MLADTYNRERIQNIISQERSTEGRSAKILNIELPLFSLCGVADSVTSLASMCDNIQRVLPTKEAHQASVFRFFFFYYFFLLGVNHVNMGK